MEARNVTWNIFKQELQRSMSKDDVNYSLVKNIGT